MYRNMPGFSKFNFRHLVGIASQDGLKEITRLVEKDILKPEIKVYKCSEVHTAFKCSMTTHVRGKVVVSMDDGSMPDNPS